MALLLTLQSGLRLDLDAKADAGALLAGEPWLITDENALAVATSCNDYIVLQDKAIWFGEDIDCQYDPLYPAARAGETRRVVYPGRIGGPNGISATKNALIICQQNSAEGTQEQVGLNWIVVNDTTQLPQHTHADAETGGQLQHNALSGRDVADAHSQYVQKSLFDANTVLAASSDDTPVALPMSASTILARLVDGNIKAASVSEILALLGVDVFAGQLALLGFRQAIGDALASGELVDGHQWTFTMDELAIKTNAMWDSSGKYYHNLSTSTNIVDSCTASEESYKIVPANANAGVSQSFNLSSQKTIEYIKLYLRNNTSITGSATVKLYKATGTVGTDAKPTGSPLATSGEISLANFSSAGWVTFTLPSPCTLSAGNYCVVFSMVSASGSFDGPGRTSVTTSHDGNEAYCDDGSTWNGRNSFDMLFELIEESTSVTNVTLKPAAVTVALAPSDATLYFLHKAVDPVTMGTDLKVRVSSDGGSNWSDYGMPTELADYNSDYKLWRADFDLSSLPGGTSLQWEISTYNTKEQRVRAVALNWG